MYTSTPQLNPRLHYRALRVLFLRNDLDFEGILKLQAGFSIHSKHLQILATERFKSLHKLNPEFILNCFASKTNKYNLRAKFILKLPSTKTHSYGLNSIRLTASILWNNLPNEYKSCKNLNEFKHKIKSWDRKKSINCRNFNYFFVADLNQLFVNTNVK